jgi:HAD superfamily hydrolase (TIGR01509 family)
MSVDHPARTGWLLFDWGDTLMRDDPSADGPMVSWPEVEIIPDAIEVLTGLRSKWRIAIATNAAASDEPEIWAALRRVDLDRLIEKIYCYRKVGHKKPSREFFTYILKDLDLTVNEVVMVGDSFETDVLGANQVGIRAVWLNERSGDVHNGDMYRTIQNLRALPQVLDDLLARSQDSEVISP